MTHPNPIMPEKWYHGFSQVAAAESHLQIMQRWLRYYQDRRKEDGSADEAGIRRAQESVDRAEADVELQRELRGLEQAEKNARGGWYGTETVENQHRYRTAEENIRARADAAAAQRDTAADDTAEGAAEDDWTASGWYADGYDTAADVNAAAADDDAVACA